MADLPQPPPPAGDQPAESQPPPPQPQQQQQKKQEPEMAKKKKEVKDWRKEMNDEGKVKRKRVEDKLKLAKEGRQYLFWEDANDIEWRTYMEYMGWKNWKTKFGPGTEWWERYQKWLCSGMTRGAMRKPSFRGVEWLKWRRGIEIAPVGERCTRNRVSIRDYFVEPLDNYCCRPCPWPKLTSEEVGWLGQHESCQLEIYPNDFMRKPPLPWWQPKISTYPSGSKSAQLFRNLD